MCRRIFVVALLVGLAATTTSRADEEPVVQEPDRVVYQKKTVIDFSDVNVEGDLVKPAGSYIKNRKKTKFRNLIELRGNFRPELKRSVSAL